MRHESSNSLSSQSGDIPPHSSNSTGAGNPVPRTTGQQHVWGRLLLSGVLIGLGFGTGWLVASSRRTHQEKESLPTEVVDESHRSKAVTVTVEPVMHRPVQRTVEALGTLHGYEEVPMTARVEGRVRKVYHDVSDRVEPGELLLEIDPTDYELAAQQAEKGLQVELAKLGLKDPPDARLDLSRVPVVMKAKSLMDHAKSRLDRVTRLALTKNASAEESENVANDYRTAQAEFDNQMIQAESGLATIQMKQVDLLVVREKLANTKIVVPSPTMTVPGLDRITYVVAQRAVAEGTVVRPGSDLFRVVISQSLKLRVPVPERFAAEIQQGQQVQVFTAAALKPCSGSVTRIYPTVDATTRTFQVEIQVPNPNGELKPGSFAKASIYTNLDAQATTVPLSALVQFAGITKIFLMKEGRAKEVPVTLGTQTTEWVEITKPQLPREALVITSGHTTIANDTAITIRVPAKSEFQDAAGPPATTTQHKGEKGVEVPVKGTPE